MALTNEQFDSIMSKYEQVRNHNANVEADRKKEIYEKFPRIKEINDEMANLSLKASIEAINGDTTALRRLSEEGTILNNEKDLILERAGYKKTYLDPIYNCKDCKDTGYIGNEKCHCLKQYIINELYSQSNLNEILHRENFDNFCFDYYSPSYYDKVTGKNALENIEEVVDYCHHYIKTFDSTFTNIIIYGNTGVGKTYLSNCIAKELIEKGKSVIYLSAVRLFEILGDYTFNSKRIENVGDTVNNILNCDLLIIDDLGTEFANSFTPSAFFNVLNERLLASKSTIISTNLFPGDIAKKYTERISSRIVGNYVGIKVFGEDIRQLNRS